MKFRPLHDRVVLEPDRCRGENHRRHHHSRHRSRKSRKQGRVVAIGPGGRDESGKLIPIDVKVGDRVLFGKWSGTEVKIDGVEYLIMKESDIMGVLAEAEAKEEEGRLTPLNSPDRRSLEIDFISTRTMHRLYLILATRPLAADKDEVKPKGILKCLRNKLNSQSMRATVCCTASTRSPTRCA